jgi:hypothetical protein
MSRATIGLALVMSAALSACAPRGREVNLPSGTVMTVRLNQALSTVRNRAGDTFDAVLEEPVLVDGKQILPTGTNLSGKVNTAEASGRLGGRGVLAISLDALTLDGKRYPIETALNTKTTEAHQRRNIELIGGGAGVGAVIGGIAGGGKGAGIGAAIGAGGGTAVAATTGRKDVEVPAETVFEFSLTKPVTVRVVS